MSSRRAPLGEGLPPARPRLRRTPVPGGPQETAGLETFENSATPPTREAWTIHPEGREGDR